jgi:hypothetical protein
MERAMTVTDTAAELVVTFPFLFNVRSLSFNAKVEVLCTEIVVLLRALE